jgi:very-short-patch-repair endonuclease
MPDKPRPLDAMTLDHVRDLRQKGTPPEQLLWAALRGRRLGGLKFRRQHPIAGYIVDFCCIEKKLIIELDGTSHEEKSRQDSQRTAILQREGFHVFRVTNSDVNRDLEAVVRGIAREAGVAYD